MGIQDISPDLDRSNPVLTGVWHGGGTPVEVEISSLRILREAELEEAEWVKDRCI